MEKLFDIVAIGECLLELSTNSEFSNASSFDLDFGGDVIISAIAAHKMGSRVGLVSTIGDDYFKDIIFEKLNSEGIDTSNINLCNEKNGLYLCSRTNKDELITYRRRVASSFLSIQNCNMDYIKSSRAVYTTGLIQSLSISANELVKSVFKEARENDILTAYDPNYTSSFMTTYDTKEYMEDIIENIDVLFITLKSEVDTIYGLSSPERIINYFSGCGVKTIVVKSHIDKKYYVNNNGKTETCDFETNSVGIIGSGDVFNGGFLSAITNGYTPFEAVRIAAKQAGIYKRQQNGIGGIPTHDELLRE